MSVDRGSYTVAAAVDVDDLSRLGQTVDGGDVNIGYGGLRAQFLGGFPGGDPPVSKHLIVCHQHNIH